MEKLRAYNAHFAESHGWKPLEYVAGVLVVDGRSPALTASVARPDVKPALQWYQSIKFRRVRDLTVRDNTDLAHSDRAAVPAAVPLQLNSGAVVMDAAGEQAATAQFMAMYANEWSQ
jgi:hypothetical protein